MIPRRKPQSAISPRKLELRWRRIWLPWVILNTHSPAEAEALRQKHTDRYHRLLALGAPHHSIIDKHLDDIRLDDARWERRIHRYFKWRDYSLANASSPDVVAARASGAATDDWYDDY